jgi:hypothetical protein
MTLEACFHSPRGEVGGFLSGDIQIGESPHLRVQLSQMLTLIFTMSVDLPQQTPSNALSFCGEAHVIPETEEVPSATSRVKSKTRDKLLGLSPEPGSVLQ